MAVGRGTQLGFYPPAATGGSPIPLSAPGGFDGPRVAGHTLSHMHSNDVVAKVKRITIKVLIAAVALAIVGSALYTFATLEFSYSEGERVGFVQ